MTGQLGVYGRAIDRLPPPGAGFVWDDTDGIPFLRPVTERAVRAGFTTRMGGTSPAPWDALNLSFTAGDDPRCVSDNRSRASSAVGAGRRWATAQQVHGSRVVHADAPGVLGRADGLWAGRGGPTLAVLVADCVPVLASSPDGRVAVGHAGWRGLVRGIVEELVGAINADLVWAGPAIGPCCFRVGDDVATRIRDRLGSGVLTGPVHVDLWRAVEVAAHRAGAQTVRSARACTACTPMFFSHRRDDGRTGRQAVVAAVAEEDRDA